MRRIAARPTLWVELTVLAAWTLLLLGAGLAWGASGSETSPGWAGGPLWLCTTGMGAMGGAAGPGATSSAAAGPPSLLAATPMWALMTVAMTIPAGAPAIRHVAGKSLWWRRRRALIEFLLVFLGLWFAYGALVLGPLSSWGPADSPYALVVGLALAALWQLTPLKREAMRACHRSRPLPPRGWRASAGVADFALHNGSACLASCWAMMLAAALAGPSMLLWMGAMTAVMTAEKTAKAPERAARKVATLLAAAALGVLLATIY